MNHASVHTPATTTSAVPLTAARLPSAPLLFLGAMVVALVLGLGAMRVLGIGVSRAPEAKTVATREFRFEDRPDGSIAVLDGTGTHVIDTVAPGTNGFLRGTLRGLARERHRQSIGAEVPFRMTGRADGSLTLEDPTTGRRVDLGSFGPTNAAVFARIMAIPAR